MAVTLAVVLVFTVVALVMWRLAERTARTEGRRVARLQRRTAEQRQEITALSADNAALIQRLSRYEQRSAWPSALEQTVAALLTPDADDLADRLNALYDLPAYNPEEHR